MMDSSPFQSGRKPTAVEELIVQSFARLHKAALGIAVGVLTGFVIFAATVILLIKGGPDVGPNLALLGQYFIGYSVTWTGSLIGLLYGFVFGFIGGWLIAFLRNILISAYLQIAKLKTRFSHLADPFE
jgi:hypothetical protein